MINYVKYFFFKHIYCKENKNIGFINIFVKPEV